MSNPQTRLFSVTTKTPTGRKVSKKAIYTSEKKIQIQNLQVTIQFLNHSTTLPYLKWQLYQPGMQTMFSDP